MMRNLLVRGMLVGVVAGLLAWAFAWVFGEPEVRHAITFEEAHSAHDHNPAAMPGMDMGGHDHGDESEPVSRGVQSTVGLLTGVGVYGIAIGGLFALVFALAYGRLGPLGARATAGVLGLVGFVAVVLVPFLKYPAQPPAVGDPDTITERTVQYFGLIAVSIVAAVAAAVVARRLVPRLGTANAILASVGGYIVVMALIALALPSPETVPEGFDATVLWRFRIASLGVQAVIWSTFGLLFGVVAAKVVERPRDVALAA
ncbi:CbtA family protein [Yinghuangia seranimata]|uniref:CbtA family protein n=1 Tax=Yinghuangia seranimata TaxID=408067 RepID=UPI00248D0FC9|nr:CbtA family protein [Yinghuangia seranimata]MDI2132080.1 CbtA family protein [Yinghuangia seranimata]